MLYSRIWSYRSHNVDEWREARSANPDSEEWSASRGGSPVPAIEDLLVLFSDEQLSLGRAPGSGLNLHRFGRVLRGHRVVPHKTNDPGQRARDRRTWWPSIASCLEA